MTSSQKDYAALLSQGRKIKLLESISFLLEWDQETYMPKSAFKIRSEQLALLASLAHKEKAGKSFETKLKKLIDVKSGKILGKNLTPLQESSLKNWRRDLLKAMALPNTFVKNFTKLSSESMSVWGDARKANDFKMFAPYLEKIVAQTRKKAEYLGFKDHPYDALLDLFEPGFTTKDLDALFGKIRTPIAALLKKITASPQVDDHFLHGSFSEDKQLEFGRFVLSQMGYDMNKGRLDLSKHPFSMSLHPTDSRVTTRIHKTSVFDCISSTLHEGGHSLYEMNMNEAHYGSPLAEAASYGIHESQSRFWETRIGQSEAYWKHFLPALKKLFPKLDKVSVHQFYKAINKVEPSLIRVESDEVSYTLHIILRYELEKSLIEGTLKVKELPEAWGAKMKELLGVVPHTDSDGCLQDVHWSMGAFGYFPSYSLGNLYAAQLFDAFAKAHPDWEKRVGNGELLFIKDWLQEHVHQWGRAFLPGELVKNASGKEFSPKHYLDYLTDKYGKIYNL